MKNLEEIDEEFNNFMYRVNEISSIVKKLSSKDEKLQNIGNLEAEKYLKDSEQTVLENIDDEQIKLKIKSDKSVINWKALKKDDGDSNTMSQEAFMEEVSRDADRRYKEKLIRKEKSETFKKQATLAFRRGDYERALTCYNKAIEQIRDSCQLYINRCLTYIMLELYQKAIDDAETALKLNENSLKARLLLAKACYKSEKHEEYQNAVKEAKERNPKHIQFIDDYIQTLEQQQTAETEKQEDSN